MQNIWLKNEGKSKLFLFFNGWAMDENVVKHLQSVNADILVIYDYCEMEFHVDLSRYEQISLIAWSMGVFAANLIAPKLKNLTKAIAINGTPCPIDKDFGIHPKIYKITQEMMSEKARNSFFSKMFVSDDYKKLVQPNRTLENQITELAQIEKHQNSSPTNNFKYDSAFISENDKIIPTKNQKNFWNTKDIKVVKLDCGHYPFFEFNSWEEIENAAS